MGAYYFAAASTTGAASFPHAVCNTTDQCVVIDPNMACSSNLCICPSSAPGPMTMDSRICNATAGSLFPLSLGAACTADANCSSSALCLAGQCSCPSGFQPWDEHNCTAIQTEDPSSSWMSPLLPLSGFGLIILLVVCVCASTQWSYGSRWAKSYIGDKESAPTLIVWSQASIGDQTPSVPLALQPASPNTDSLAQQQMDSELFNEGLCSQHDSWLAAVAERSSELTNQLNSLTELRGLCSVPEESFVRPELSGDEMYSKYPHLRLILSTTSSSSAHVPAQRRPTPLTPVHTETTPSASRQTSESELTSSKVGLRPALQSPTSRKRAARSESPSKRVAFPDELAASSVLQPESESEQLGQRSAALQAFRRSSSTPWSTFGSSLDSLLSAPVVARIVTSSSCTDDAVSHTTTSAKSNDHQPTLSTSTYEFRVRHGAFLFYRCHGCGIVHILDKLIRPRSEVCYIASSLTWFASCGGRVDVGSGLADQATFLDIAWSLRCSELERLRGWLLLWLRCLLPLLLIEASR
ncbi:uncharacterized protein LOC119444882 [Dermacentor silvarum]|uniref:uncharacterized protein LOC119444882 n=1 Tax=Dermacentor silvarum TaxID=543639 RepID=UPI002101AB86|nr:uncharacterized protein LOC119444882 [Dermacentor silvarum]